MKPEETLQCAVVNHLTVHGVPGLMFWHTPNGGKRGKAEGGRFKAMGVRAGVSDLILFDHGRLYALELKVGKGKPTDAQLTFLNDIRKAGGAAFCANGMDEALACLRIWGLLRGTVLERVA